MNRYKFSTAVLAFFFGVLFSFTACYEDKGNYNYTDLDEVVIDTVGLGFQELYSIYRYDTLELNPHLYYKGKRVTSAASVADELEITWSVFPYYVSADGHTRDTISHEVGLYDPITKPTGRWNVMLSVTDLKTDVAYYMKFTVQIDEVISDGWMVLYETTDGNSDAGLIVHDYIKQGVLQDRTFIDLYSASNGSPMEGKPLRILHSTARIDSREVIMTSEYDMAGLRYTSFETDFPFETLFWDAPETKALGYFTAVEGSREIVLNNNRIHYVNHSIMGSTRVTNGFGEGCPAEDGVELENWLACALSSSSAFSAVGYDKNGKKFVQVPNGGIRITAFDTQLPTAAFDVNKVGLNFIASDWGRNRYEYTVAGSGQEYALLVSNFYNGQATSLGLGKYDMSSCPQISSISDLAAAFEGEYIYYSAGHNLYTFKYNSGGQTDVVWSAPANEEITCVRLQKYYMPSISTMLLNNNQVIWIGTWNESTQEGKVYAFKVDPANGSVDASTGRIDSGFGKVKDMGWKWTL